MHHEMLGKWWRLGCIIFIYIWAICPFWMCFLTSCAIFLIYLITPHLSSTTFSPAYWTMLSMKWSKTLDHSPALSQSISPSTYLTLLSCVLNKWKLHWICRHLFLLFIPLWAVILLLPQVIPSLTTITYHHCFDYLSLTHLPSYTSSWHSSLSPRSLILPSTISKTIHH